MIFEKPFSAGKDARISSEIIAMQNWAVYHPAVCLGPTAVGQTFESLIGISQNNSRDADYKGVEVKAKRTDPHNLLTLYTKNPRFPKDEKGEFRARRLRPLVKEFGQDEFHEDSGEMRRRLYQTIDNSSKSSSQKFSLKDHGECLELVCKSSKEVVAVWTIEDFLDGIKKLTNLVVADVDNRKMKGDSPECFLLKESKNKRKKAELARREEFRYKTITYYWGFNPQKFYDKILNGEAYIDIRAHIKLEQKTKAFRDHGTAFRIFLPDLVDLYDGHEIIDLNPQPMALAA